MYGGQASTPGRETRPLHKKKCKFIIGIDDCCHNGSFLGNYEPICLQA